MKPAGRRTATLPAVLARVVGVVGMIGLAIPVDGVAQSAAQPAVQPAAAAIQPRVLLVADRETTLVAPMVGTVQQLAGELGGSVARGAVIARYECSEQRARVGMARAELQSADEQLKAKERLQGLAAAGDVEVTLARSQLAKARAQLDLGQAQASQCTVLAPFAGRIARLHIREHQGVNVGQPIVDLVSTGPLRVRLNAPSRWLAWLRPGAVFTVRIDETGRDYRAVLTAINARVDAASQSIELEGRIDGQPLDLLAGMSGAARFGPANP